MFIQLKRILHCTMLALGIMILPVLLVACGTTSSGTTSNESTSASTPTLPPTATTAAMATLAGNGFTMNYPQSLHLTRSGSRLVTLTDSTGTIQMAITVVLDPNGTISADAFVDTALKVAKVPLKNIQTESIPSKATVAGETWSQKSVSGTMRLNNTDTVIKAVVIANVHPGNAPASKGYTIAYSSPKSTFDQADTTYFRPMLDSFKFSS